MPSSTAAAMVACAAVLLGTLYPLVIDALGMGKISVGPPYFDTVFIPLMTPAIFLMGVGPLARWKEAELPDLARRLRAQHGGARRALRRQVEQAAVLRVEVGADHAGADLGVLEAQALDMEIQAKNQSGR